MTEVQEEVAVQEEQAPAHEFAVILELEHIITNTRQAAYDVIKNILSEKSLNVSPSAFARVCMNGQPENYLEELYNLAGKKKGATTKLSEDVRSGIAMHASSSSLSPNAGVSDFLAKVQEKPIQIAAMSALPENLVNNLLEKAGLDPEQVQTFSYDDANQSYPRADTWLKVSKELGMSPRNITVVASSSSCCKSALTAGMRAIGVPDSFTAFQDFGGAMQVVDSLADVNYEDLFAILD